MGGRLRPAPRRRAPYPAGPKDNGPAGPDVVSFGPPRSTGSNRKKKDEGRVTGDLTGYMSTPRLNRSARLREARARKLRGGWNAKDHFERSDTLAGRAETHVRRGSFWGTRDEDDVARGRLVEDARRQQHLNEFWQ